MKERLQKIIAAAGLASRRTAEEMILNGQVSVNGKVVRSLGTKADPASEHIKVKGKLINPALTSRQKRYLLVNKPRGHVSSLSDPQHRPLVTDLLPSSARHGLHLVGRLDLNSEGLIMLTNDGELTELLTRAGKIQKVYKVKVQGMPSDQDLASLRRGISLGGQATATAQIRMLSRTRQGGNCWYEVTLKEGKNQQIRRMFDSVGHSVVKLKRVRIGHISDKGLPLGQYRVLKPSEIQRFFESKPAKGQSLPKDAKPIPTEKRRPPKSPRGS